MVDTQETAETTALKELIEEAVKNGDILSILPEDIRTKLGNVTKVIEFQTMTLENYDATMGAVTITIKPGKTYARGEKAKVLIALPDGKGGYSYFYIEGIGQDDGSLALNIPAAAAKALAGKTFVTMIVE